MIEHEPSLPPGCPASCPGCSHRSLSASESLARKRGFLGRALAPWETALEEVRSAPEDGRLAYRERTCLRAEWREGRWDLGLLGAREPGAWKRKLVAIPECPVHSPRVRAVLECLARVLPGPEELPLLYVMISGALVTLVLKGKRQDVSLEPSWIAALAGLGVRGIHANFHPSAGNRILSKEWALLWGESRVKGSDGLMHGPSSFQQLLPGLYARALDQAEEFLAPGPDDAVIDLYSGLGSTLRRWSTRRARTIGVELSGEAVECARMNADVELLRGRCGERVPQLARWVRDAAPKRLLVYANPPRGGLEPELVTWLEKARPERIAYLSCSPGTLARDLEELKSFRAVRLLPWDFFPGTHHVETLALLTRTSAE